MKTPLDGKNRIVSQRSWRYLPIGIFFLCAIVGALAGYGLFKNFEAHEIEDTNRTLLSVGQLKARQIQSYLHERKNDAYVLSGMLAEPAARRWLATRGGAAPAALLSLTETMAEAYQYRGLLVLDADANIRLGSQRSGTLTEAGKALALRTLRARTPVHFQIHYGDASAPDVPVLDTFVPVMSSDKTRAVGMVVLRSPLDFMFALIQTWPTESATAESLLVSKDGGDVLFLNELRHQKDTALKLRVPLSTDPRSPAWPAISAVTGRFGLFEANDYRGNHVLAYALAVPDTPWGIVVKMDHEEATAHSQEIQNIATIFFAMFMACVGIALRQWWRRNETERQANERLRETQAILLKSESTLKEAQQLAQLGNWEMDEEMKTASWSEENFLIYEIPQEQREKIGYAEFINFIHPDDRKRIARAFATSVRERRPSEIEHRLLFSDGRVKWVHQRSTTVYDDAGKPLRTFGTTQDITARKNVEDLLLKSNEELVEANDQLRNAQNMLLQSEKLASIGQLAAGVAHEINNPISFVGSNLGMLEKYLKQLLEVIAVYEKAEKAIGDSSILAWLAATKHKADMEFLKDDALSLMNESREGILRVKNIVQNLNDFSRDGSNADWQLADLQPGLESTLNIARNQIKHKADVILAYGEIPAIVCIPSQLNQVFMNLLVNAAHAIEDHGAITVRTGQQGDEVWVEIADTGRGIAPEHLGRIFDPFFTTKQVGEGTGLGLSLSYGIVKKHQGRIEVQSEPGKGTSFKVWLPIHQPQDDVAQRSQ